MKKTKFAVLLTAFMAVLGLSSCLGYRIYGSVGIEFLFG